MGRISPSNSLLPSIGTTAIPEAPGFTPFVAMCFTVNYIMGTGFLTLPLAFSEAGIMLSVVALGLVCFLSNVSKNYILEAMCRANALASPRKTDTSPTESSSSSYGAAETSRLVPATTSQRVSTRKFEIVEMCTLFLGGNARRAYMATLGLYMFGTLWVYTTVFGHAMASTVQVVGVVETDYLIWVAVFAVVVVPLTCMELREQMGVQVVLSMARFAMVILMVGTTVAAMSADGEDDNGQFGDQTSANTAPLANIQGLYKMIPIAVYANIYHHSIPGLSMPVADKSKLGFIFGVTFAFGMFAYSLIGGTVAWYFGDMVKVKGANINWSEYHAGTGHKNDAGDWVDRAWWVSIISVFVVCFPALDVVSAFPLNGITLGNNLMVMYYGDKVGEHENDKRITNLFRLAVAVPPILCASKWNNINKITDYTGITGFLIAFTFPAALHYYSKKAAVEKGMSATNEYSTQFWSDDSMTFAVGAFGLVLVVFVLGSLLITGAD